MQCDENTHSDQSPMIVPLTRPPSPARCRVSPWKLRNREMQWVGNTGLKEGDGGRKAEEKRESNRSDLADAER